MSLYVIIKTSDFSASWTVMDLGSNTWRQSTLEKYVLSLKKNDDLFDLGFLSSITAMRATYKSLRRALDNNDIRFHDNINILDDQFTKDQQCRVWLFVR